MSTTDMSVVKNASVYALQMTPRPCRMPGHLGTAFAII